MTKAAGSPTPTPSSLPRACQAESLEVGCISEPSVRKLIEGGSPTHSRRLQTIRKGNKETVVRNVLQLLTEVSAKGHIPVLLIGGYALQAYGVIRQTLDVDVLVSEAHAAEMDAALHRAGYTQLVRSEIFARYRHPSMVLADVDILFVDSETAKKMVQHSMQCTLAETTCLVPALSHLLALKLHAMRSNLQREARDFADIVELVRANSGSISKDELHNLCATYGPEGIWEKLEAALWKTP